MKNIFLIIMVFVSFQVHAKWMDDGFEVKKASTPQQIQEFRNKYGKWLSISPTDWYYMKELEIDLTHLKWDGSYASCYYGHFENYTEITKYRYDTEGPFGKFHEEKWGDLVDLYDPICKGSDTP